MKKALKNALPPEPQSLAFSVDLQARDAFFAYYVTSTSKSWDFLKQYYHPTDSPDHLTLAIEAVSLAYLYHQVYSQAALATARQRYISALRLINKALNSSKEAAKDTTLLASLLLDLFEKITDSEPRNSKSWRIHIDGSLALVNLRGLERFQGPDELRVLVRLSTNYLISCVASASPVPDELIAIRTYAGKHLNVQDPKWRLSDLMVLYANLLSDIRRGILSDNECIERRMDLDLRMRALDLDMPPSWQCSTTFLDAKSERAFELHFDSYAHRNVSQARNVLRLVRILLNEALIELYPASTTQEKNLASIQMAHHNIETLVADICASVPQYVDCDGAAREKLQALEMLEVSGRGPGHPHNPNHLLDCYTLIFPLYIAGRSKAAPDNVKPWVIKQLRYMGEHFCVRNAEIVAKILEAQTEVDPWKVYAMLGSYAFAA
jgi:hypothetical protein